jgi:hypothetical protein
MDNHDIRNRAQSMAKDIQNIIDAYNRLDPAFTFYPVITVTEAETLITNVKSITVETEVTYNSKYDKLRAND